MPDLRASASRLLINRNFALLWSGQTLSSLGDQVFETTLVVWIVTELAPDKSWNALAVSGLLVASTIPILFVGPVAGVLIDRWRDKRGVMVRADLLSALLVLALLPATGIVGVPGVGGTLPLAWQLGAIFLVVFLASAVAQFFRPASSVLLRDVVAEPERPRASSLNQASSSLAVLVGPPLAAPLLIAFGAQWALAINAGSFLVSLLTVRAMMLPEPPEAAETGETAGDFISEYREGLRFFRNSRVLVVVAVSLIIVTFGLGALNTLDVFFVKKNLGASEKYLGFLGAALGAGMLIGSAIAGWIAARLRLEQMVWGSLALIGLVVLVYARLTSLVPAVFVIFLLGVIIPAANVSIGPLVLRETPRELVGRVAATINPLQHSSWNLGMLLAGVMYGSSFQGFEANVLGMRIGPLDTIFTGVGVLCLAGAAFARANLGDRRRV